MTEIELTTRVEELESERAEHEQTIAEHEQTIVENEGELERRHLEIERLKGLVKGFEMSFAFMKCRDCLFRTNDPVKLIEHMESLDHTDYAIILGNDVKVDWISLEVKRKEPEP